MNAMTTIKHYNFSTYADIVRNPNGEIKFRKALSTESPDSGYVYPWLEFDDQMTNIVYVGKAGKKLVTGVRNTKLDSKSAHLEKSINKGYLRVWNSKKIIRFIAEKHLFKPYLMNLFVCSQLKKKL